MDSGRSNRFAQATMLLDHLKHQLLAMQARDLRVRSELAADGSLFEGYHPRMEEVHRANAAELRAIIGEHGWPDESLVGPKGAEAAWLIAQHAIAEPDFMCECRRLVDEASRAGRVPRWQFAYLDDRIRVFEDKPQRFGTQVDLTPDGPVPNTLDDPEQIDARRRDAGLGPIDESLSRLRDSPLPTHDEYATRQAEGALWRRKIGWIA